MHSNKPFSEVIESSLSHWLVQSWQWDTVPSFGTLVMIETPKRVLFGIVHQISTGAMDNTRYPFPYKKTHEELLREQPQIFEFLKTTFNCIPLGYQEKGKVSYLIPPEPPSIHSFVSAVPKELARDFFYHTHYLHTLFALQGQLLSTDELLLASLDHQAQLGILTHEKIDEFTSIFSLLIGNDYRRLKLFLQRAQALV